MLKRITVGWRHTFRPGISAKVEGAEEKLGHFHWMNINLAPALLQNTGRKCFVTGHDFKACPERSRRVPKMREKMGWTLAPAAFVFSHLRFSNG
jgi:hypothetical protein